MALSVVTFNIGDADGTRHEKKKMIDKFLRDLHLPSLLYFQENPWRRLYIKKHVAVIKEIYEVVSHEHFDATVFYRKDVLRDDGSAELIELFRLTFNDNKYLDFVTFKERASFSKLTEIATETTFLAISWHGEYKEKLKKEKFEELLNVISEIHSTKGFPIVLGGDFNIDLDVVSDSIENVGFEVYQYELQNRKTVIDFFVVTPDVELSGVSALGEYMYINVSVPQRRQVADNQLSGLLGSSKSKYVIYGHVEKRKQIFDHDPVQALVSFDLDNKYQDESQEEYSDDELEDVAYHFNYILFKTR